MGQSIQEKINHLTDELIHHNYLYYVLAEPVLSDREFDQLLSHLEALETDHPQFKRKDSPTSRVGGQITKDFETVTHAVPMMSLSNTYNEEELRDFDERVKGLLGETFEYTCELKFDGLAISLIYEKGTLVRAVTRGDGAQGDDVTNNVKTIRRIPHFIPSDEDRIEARGEILMHKKAFDLLNEDRVANGDKPFANARNSAAGTIKMQESDEVAKRPLDCFIYQLLEDQRSVRTHQEGIEKLKSLGLPVHEGFKVCSTIEDVLEFIHVWDEKRKMLSFETDGVVIKVNHYRQQDELGSTSKFPRWAIAYKFETERAETILESISYQVGRTGSITPVANLKPVQLLGTTVKRASLHNEDIIRELDVRIGDAVYVEKGGEIIPKIVEVNMKARKTGAVETAFITECPECNTTLIRHEGEVAHYCPNKLECPPQIKGRIEHFIGRKAMNIDSLGEGKIEILFDNGLLYQPADLYDLTKEQLVGIGKTIENEETGETRLLTFQQKTADNIIAGIEASKAQPFFKVLFALGIRFVGETVSKKLTAHFKNIDAIVAADFESLVAVGEIGDKIAQSLVDHFSKVEELEHLERLRKHGLQLESVEKEKTSNVLDGAKFVVSGVFSQLSRNEIKLMIEEHGGINASSLSANTNFLLAGEKMGPAKKVKAEKLGIIIMTEQEFITKVNEAQNG